VSIRLACVSDAAAICRVQRLSWQHLHSDSLTVHMLEALPVAEHFHAWQQRLDSAAYQTWVVEQAELMGFICLQQQAPCQELSALYLLPEWIGQGFGKALLKHACEQTKAQHLYCWVMQDNQHAQGFYRHLGFDFTGEQQQLYFAGQAYSQKKAHLTLRQGHF